MTRLYDEQSEDKNGKEMYYESDINYNFVNVMYNRQNMFLIEAIFDPMEWMCVSFVYKSSVSLEWCLSAF